MPIRVECPCGKKLQVKDDLAGKKVKCPSCEEPVRVPGGDSSSSKVAAKSSSVGVKTAPKSGAKSKARMDDDEPVTKKTKKAPVEEDWEEEEEAPAKKKKKPIVDEDDDDAPKKKKKKKSKKKALLDPSRSWTKSGILGGALLLVGGIAFFAFLYFTDGLALKPILAAVALVVFGLASIVNGIMGGQLWTADESDDDDDSGDD